MKLRELTHFLDTQIPLAYQESYDNCGLLLGNLNMDISGVLTTLDITESVLDEAIEMNCNVIVAHHPIIFSGLKKITGKNYVERIVLKSIQHNIAIYAAHTNLDNVHFGVNKTICNALGLVKTQILQPKSELYSKLIVFVPLEHTDVVSNALFEAGAGHIGNYSNTSFRVEGTGTFRGNENSNPAYGKSENLEYVQEHKLEVIIPNYLQNQIVQALLSAHPYEEVAYDILPLKNEQVYIGSGMIGELEQPLEELEFLKKIQEIFQVSCIKHTNLLNKKIQRVAVCGGSGSFLIKQAIQQKADIYITSDVKYHEFFDAENRLIIADIGHFESEQYTKNLIFQIISEKFPTLAVAFSKVNTNPVNYFK